MIKFVMSLFLLSTPILLHASFNFEVIDEPNSEKFKNRKIDFIDNWKVLKFKEITEKQKEQYLEKRWDEYLTKPGEYFVLAEENEEPVAFVFYTLTTRKAQNKDEKKWAFLSGYAICQGKEHSEKEVIPLLLDKVCEHAKTPRILTATAKTNDKMIKMISEYEFEDECFEKDEVMNPNWLERYTLETSLYYKMKR